jgi:hypothetical protein
MGFAKTTEFPMVLPPLPVVMALLLPVTQAVGAKPSGSLRVDLGPKPNENGTFASALHLTAQLPSDVVGFRTVQSTAAESGAKTKMRVATHAPGAHLARPTTVQSTAAGGAVNTPPLVMHAPVVHVARPTTA